MANVADLNLIQINNFPEVESPEDWIVVSDAAGLGYKISKENFKAFLGTVQESVPRAVTPSSPARTTDGIDEPTVVGVYPNSGGLERLSTDGYVRFIFNDGVWLKNNVPMPVSQEIESVTNGGLTGNIYDKTQQIGKQFSINTQVGTITNQQANNLTSFIPLEVGDRVDISAIDSLVNGSVWLYTEPLSAKGYFNIAAGGNVEKHSFVVPPITDLPNQKKVWMVTYTKTSTLPADFVDRLVIKRSSHDIVVNNERFFIPNKQVEDLETLTKATTTDLNATKKRVEVVEDLFGVKNIYPEEGTVVTIGFDAGKTVALPTTVRSVYFPARRGDRFVYFKNNAIADRAMFAYTIEEPNVAGVTLHGGYITDGFDNNAIKIDTTAPEDIEVNWIIFYLRNSIANWNFSDIGVYRLKADESSGGVPELPRFLHGNFSGLYKTPDTLDITDAAFLTNSNASDIYSRWDALVSAYPWRVSRNFLRYATGADGTEREDLPIYEYVINTLVDELPPEGLRTGSLRMTKAPKFLIMGGIHGNEKAASWGIYVYMKQILEKLNNNELLEAVDQNVNFRIIPILNPGGWNIQGRENLRGVDLNRTFKPLAEGEQYTEFETIAGTDWIQANLDAYAYIDYHNLIYVQGGMSYYASQWEKGNLIYSSLIRLLTQKWRDEWMGNIGNNIDGFLEKSGTETGGTTKSYAYWAGIERSCTLEASRREPDGATNSPNILRCNVDVLSNYVLGVLNTYNNI